MDKRSFQSVSTDRTSMRDDTSEWTNFQSASAEIKEEKGEDKDKDKDTNTDTGGETKRSGKIRSVRLSPRVPSHFPPLQAITFDQPSTWSLPPPSPSPLPRAFGRQQSWRIHPPNSHEPVVEQRHLHVGDEENGGNQDSTPRGDRVAYDFDIEEQYRISVINEQYRVGCNSTWALRLLMVPISIAFYVAVIHFGVDERLCYIPIFYSWIITIMQTIVPCDHSRLRRMHRFGMIMYFIGLMIMIVLGLCMTIPFNPTTTVRIVPTKIEYAVLTSAAIVYILCHTVSRRCWQVTSAHVILATVHSDSASA